MTVTHKGDPSRMAVPRRRTRGSVRGERAWVVRGSPKNDMKKLLWRSQKTSILYTFLVTYNCIHTGNVNDQTPTIAVILKEKLNIFISYVHSYNLDIS